VGPLAALGRITGTIAHELGTPLNTVLGYTQILLSEGLPDGARESVQIIETQIQRMVNIIQHYLSRTREVPREHHPTDVNDLVRETLVLLEPVCRQHQVQVDTGLAKTLPLLNAESASLQRVVINLLNNAIDAMDTGGRVVVTTRMSSPPETPRSGIVVEVKDTGSGIPPELLPRVFDLFVTTKAPGKGTGFGLIVCQEIIEAHDGTIEISSQFGAGTCVRVFLPVDEAAALSPVAEEER
jgi:signal transduction histidine kinase